MRSLHGWQPARPSKRTCVLLMRLWFFIKTEVLLGIIYRLCPDGLKQKHPVRSPPIYPIDPRPPGINVGTCLLCCFMLFSTFMFVIFLHFFILHSTLQQMDFVHLSALKNRMGDLKDWPLQFGENNSTHFRTSCSTKNEKMWSFWGLFDPLAPSDQCWILWLWSNLCICQHLSLMDFVRLSALENRMGELKVRPGQIQ